MEPLKKAREVFEFHNVWTYDGKIIYKDVNDNKIKTYYEQKLNFEGFLQMTINGNHLCWKISSRHFVYLSFCFVLGFWGLFAYATSFHRQVFFYHWYNAPLIFCFELTFCFETMSQIIFLIIYFSLVTTLLPQLHFYKIIKHIYISF